MTDPMQHALEAARAEAVAEYADNDIDYIIAADAADKALTTLAAKMAEVESQLPEPANQELEVRLCVLQKAGAVEGTEQYLLDRVMLYRSLQTALGGGDRG